MNSTVFPQNLYVGALTPSVMLFGDGALKKVTRLNKVIKGGPQSRRTGVL